MQLQPKAVLSVIGRALFITTYEAMKWCVITITLLGFSAPWWSPWLHKEFLIACEAYHTRLTPPDSGPAEPLDLKVLPPPFGPGTNAK